MDNEKLEGLLERGVSALEALAQDPVIEMQTGPPVCPHCETINPKVRVSEHEDSGRMGGFVIRMHCLHCNEVFYSIPMQWACVKTTDEAAQVMEERADISGIGS